MSEAKMDNGKENWIVQLSEKETDIWHSDIDCDSREEALRLGAMYAKEEGLKSFWIGRILACGMSNISVDSILEDAQEQLFDEVGEVAETYLDNTTTEQEKELEEKLNEVFYEWHKKHNLFPTCYMVQDIEQIKVY